LFFSGAAGRRFDAQTWNPDRRLRVCGHSEAAPLKNKKEKVGWIASLQKQATPTAFEPRPKSGPYVHPPNLWVMTSAEAGC
jgi:hypothetical protein